MGAKFDYEGALSEIRLDFEKLGKSTEKLEGKTLKKACETVAKSVKNNLKRSTRNLPDYVHMQDDVKVSNAKKDRDGAIIRTVGGGKKTGAKWHLLNDGTYSKNNATHFMDISVSETETEVDSIFDNAIEQMLKELG
ncbi:HK97-gp10 family putative phage morphogenesis protein [uncultured Clostridium sp.]|uniref:HK97-gp10 family putative phage morphogenesis protein n=1 Tax=uncultured Clostridium sp. TaxID=59620 RepID=UPI0028EA9BED|nr:HK97-gp10 family putative phage morphogenesis protein [uncultured Clostridium sp.]